MNTDPELATEDASLGETIKRLRLSRGFSLNELARASDVSGGTLSQIERGRVSPSMRTLTKIRTALGVALSELFTEEPTPSLATPDFVRRADDRHIIDLGEGLMVKEFICPAGMGDMMVMELVIASANGSGDEPYSYPGEKAGVVMVVLSPSFGRAGLFEVWSGLRS